MYDKAHPKRIGGLLLLLSIWAAMHAAAAESTFRAGAARVEITPAVADLPQPFKAVHDPIYVRALVFDDGMSQAALVVLDVPMIATKELAELKGKISDASGIPETRIALIATHNPNAILVNYRPVGIKLPGSAKLTADMMAATVAAVSQAIGDLRPARAGYAADETPLIGPRPQLASAASARAQSPTGAVDRTLGVLKVETPAGVPIAFLINAGLEPSHTQGASAQISGGMAGTVVGHVEQRYGDKVVAMYTLGAYGYPRYSAAPPGSSPAADTFAIANAVGVLLGEDALATAARAHPASDLKISMADRTLQCPSKESGTHLLKMGLLTVGDVHIVLSDSYVTPSVWLKTRSLLPANSFLIAQIYGPMHFVVDDAAYASDSYEMTESRVKPGCAEQGFVDRTLDMLKRR
jgi:neutral ceramidase